MNGANGTVTVKDGAVNRGTIELFNTDPSFTGLGVYKAATNDYTGTYANAGSLITSDPNHLGSPRVITGNIVNSGNITIGKSLDVYGTLRDNIGGYIDVATGQTLQLHSGQFIQDGGSLLLRDGASLAFAGGSYQYLRGSVTVLSNLVFPGGATIRTPDTIAAAGPGAKISIPIGGITVETSGQIVAQGGGNVSVLGGGNFRAQNGGTIIATDAGIASVTDGGSLIGNAGGLLVALDGGILSATNGTAGPSPGANIIADHGTIMLNNGFAHADGRGILRNGGLLTGSGTFTASAFVVDADSTVQAIGGTLHLIGAINSFNAGTLTTGHWYLSSPLGTAKK